MGRIKTLMIKKAASQLFEEVEGFTEDFEKNKKLLKDTMPSKSVRNRVAGGLVKLAGKQKKKTKKKKTESEEVLDEQRDG
jgi:ribosomal protein S17E